MCLIMDGVLEWRIGFIVVLFIQERVHRDSMLVLQDAWVIVACRVVGI